MKTLQDVPAYLVEQDGDRRVPPGGGLVIVMAVSLNIVNGWTGQFSIGHAGLMTLGGYAAGMVTLYGSLMLWGESATEPGRLFGAGEWLLVAGCFVGFRGGLWWERWVAMFCGTVAAYLVVALIGFSYFITDGVRTRHFECSVQEVRQGMPAYGKLERGDVIVAIDGEPLERSPSEMIDARNGAPVRLTVQRGSGTRDITIQPIGAATINASIIRVVNSLPKLHRMCWMLPPSTFRIPISLVFCTDMNETSP